MADAPRVFRLLAAKRSAMACVALIAVAGLSVGAQAADSEFDATTGYRIARYRAPVPASVAGGSRITAPDVADLVKTRNAILLDVMPSDGIGPDPKTGAWLSYKPRQHIPGSHWLPDVGKGDLTPTMDAYFKANLERLTGGDKARAVIVYCQADCWMSWNAVKRAATYGYAALFWFSEGTDGWRDWDGKFVPAVPVPVGPANGP